VLLEGGLFFRPFRTADGKRGHLADASSLQFLVEELIAHSAVEVGVTASSVLGSAVGVLPKAIRKRVRLLDENGHIQRKCDALFAEIADELHLELGGRAVGIPEIGSTDAHTAVAGLYLEFYPYLVALEYEMELSARVTDWAEQADGIRGAIKNPEARAVLAAISGLSRTYHRIESEHALVRSDAHPRLVEHFEELVEDQAYKHLSEHTRLLGIPAKLEFAKSRMGSVLRSLLEKPLGRELLSAGSRVVTAATKVPLPDAGSFSRVLTKSYLPPVVSFSDTVRRAKAAWKQARPDFVPLPGYEYRVTPEWDDVS
jgi:hypothetical protein